MKTFNEYLETVNKSAIEKSKSLLALKKKFLKLENELTLAWNQDDPIMDLNDLKDKTEEEMKQMYKEIQQEYKKAKRKGEL